MRTPFLISSFLMLVGGLFLLLVVLPAVSRMFSPPIPVNTKVLRWSAVVVSAIFIALTLWRLPPATF